MSKKHPEQWWKMWWHRHARDTQGVPGINAHSHLEGAGPAHIGSGLLSVVCSGILQASF